MASKRIAGITIEIGGDTSKLQNALKGADKQISTTQSTLRDVEKLLKFNPGNTELLTQKQKYLTQAIDDTKDRLKTLKSVQTDALSPEKYDALQREIIETESKLKNLEGKYKEFGSVAGQQLQAVGKKIQEVGGKITNIGETLTKYVTTPIVALGTGSAMAFKEVDTGLDTIRMKTGATGEAFDEMEGIMKNLASEIPTDFETAGAAVGEVNTRFNVNGQQLEDLSGKYIKFAQLNNTDVSGAIDSTQKALSAYGLTADDAGDYLDRLTKVSQDTGVDVGKLADGIISNATEFKEMGLSIDDATVFMGKLEKSGANSETVLNGMRKALKNATEQGIPLDQALSDLQNTIQNGTGSMDGLSAAYDLFGKSGDQIYGAVRDGTIDFTDLVGAAGELGDVVGDTFESTLDPADEFTMAMNDLKTTGAEIAEVAMPAVSEALKVVRDVITELRDQWNSLDEGQQQSILTAIGVVAAAGPIITVIGGIVTGIGGLITNAGIIAGFVSTTLIPTITAIGAALAPFIFPAGLIIAGLIAAGVAIYKNWDKIKEAAKNLKDNISKAWNDLKTNVVNTVENLKANITDKWSSAKNTVITTVDNIKASVTSKFDAMKSTVMNTFNNLKNAIITPVTAARDKLSGIVDRIKNLFNFQWSLPRPKMPHFNWSWESVGGLVSLPKFSVQWYRKAYDNPLMFSRDTILPTAAGLKGFGDGPGAEMVYGKNNLMRDIRAAVGPTGNTYTFNVYAQPGQSAREIANEVQRILVREDQQRRAAHA